jgi:hypothetical protein
MTPRFAFLSLALLAACGGPRATAPTTSSRPATRTTVLVSSQPLVDREPVRDGAETLYAEYVMSVDGKTHDRLMLAGEVTCYGGPALEGNVPVEVYIRRGVSDEQIVEDTVAIFPDDLVPRRQLLAMTPGEGPTELREGAVSRGHALLGDDRGAEAVQVFSVRDGGIVILAHSAKAHAMTFVAHRLDPDLAAAQGLALDQLATADDWAKLLANIGSIAADSTVMTYKGELPAIPAAECGEMFSHFPPPQRR